jgi:hypothetical protein
MSIFSILLQKVESEKNKLNGTPAVKDKTLGCLLACAPRRVGWGGNKTALGFPVASADGSHQAAKMTLWVSQDRWNGIHLSLFSSWSNVFYLAAFFSAVNFFLYEAGLPCSRLLSLLFYLFLQ